jgi:hypothetical protein
MGMTNDFVSLVERVHQRQRPLEELRAVERHREELQKFRAA